MRLEGTARVWTVCWAAYVDFVTFWYFPLVVSRLSRIPDCARPPVGMHVQGTVLGVVHSP